MTPPLLRLSLLCCLAAAPAAAQIPDGKELVNSLGMKLVRIEAGGFVMGAGESAPRSRDEWSQRDWDEAPAHKVTIIRAFFLGAHEVTNAQFERLDPDHKKLRGQGGTPKGDDDPVVYVSWDRAVAFCGWLSKAEGRTYRLPTEAEWEFACRAGTTTAFSTGDALAADQANFGVGPDGKARPSAVRVGSYKPNPWGLFDMHGNVAEWCSDWHGPYEAGEQADPTGRADGYARVVRGWSFLSAGKNTARFCRSSNRSGFLPEDANRTVGFRVVLGEPPTTAPLPAIALPHQKDVKQAAAGKVGPDPAKPYFVNFAAQKKNPTIAKDTWGPIFSAWNHYAAACVCPNGDVLAAWYTTVDEAGRELCQAASRLRAGSDTWDPASLFFDVPDVNDHAPVLFSDGKRVYHFSTQSLRGWDNATNVIRFSDDSGATWSKPRIILSRDSADALSQPCSAFAAKDGTLVLACDGDNHRDERLMISSDRGETWRVAKSDLRKAAGRYAIHPAAAPTADGAGVIAFLRGPHPLSAFTSRDFGDTWTPLPVPFPGISVGQKAAALRLNSGALLLISIDNLKKLVGGGTYAALSLDDGKTWPHVRKLEGVTGYMSAAQAPDGTIYAFGSRMGCAAFNEAWVREGKPAE